MLTQMEQEARETPSMVAKQWIENQAVIEALTARLQKNPPLFVMTAARGSSDHAATFAKYAFESRANWVTVSAALSIFTVYQQTLPLKNCFVIGISQSGNSPDVTAVLTAARQRGAITAALVNDVNSPLAQAAEYVLPTQAGVEKAVAATKTYLGNLSVVLQLIAVLTRDAELSAALKRLPEQLTEALQMDWSAAIETYHDCRNTLLIGRGYGLGIAQEAALKFKETSCIHAEAFSSAELLHGPFGLVTPSLPLFFMAQNDETLPSLLQAAERVNALGAKVLLALPNKSLQTGALQKAASIVLPLPASLHALCDPLLVIQAFYMMVARLSVARGFNPDAPLHLTKVTQTW